MPAAPRVSGAPLIDIFGEVPWDGHFWKAECCEPVAYLKIVSSTIFLLPVP
jgi:hypothetical protein